MSEARPRTDQRSGEQEVDQANAMAELQLQYDRLVGRNLAGVYRTTLEGRFLECNDALARILGYADRAELMAAKAVDIYPSAKEREHFLDTLKKARKLVNYELTLKHRSGRLIDVLENVYLDEEEGKAPTVQGTLIDITAYRQTELEQRALMDSYRDLVEYIRDGLIVLQKGMVRYANPAAVEMFGKQLVGVAFSTLFSGDPAALLRDQMTGPARTPVGPMEVRSASGRELILYGMATIFEGAPAWQLTLQDPSAQQQLLRERLRVQMAEEVNEVLRNEIAEHKRTQEALRLSRRFARSLIDSSLDMIMAVDPQGHITEFNPAAAIRFGWEPGEVLGKDSAMLYADASERDMVQRELHAHGMFSGEIRNVDSKGGVFTTFLAASRLYDEDGTLLGVMGVSRDITRIKEDRQALEASEERYRDLFENATDLIQSVDEQGRFQYVNAAWRTALGYQPHEVDHLRLEDVIHPDHRASCIAQFQRVMDGEDVGTISTVFMARDGREVIVEGTTNLRRMEGQVLATRSIFRDVTKVRQARRELEEHEAKLRALFESSEHMFWTVDRGIKLTSFNHGYAAMVERLHGKKPKVNTDPQRPRELFADRAYHAFWEAKYAAALAGQPVRFETDRTDVHGQRVCNEIFLSPVFGPDGQVNEVFGIGHEITEQKEAENLVREQTARLSAIFESSANMMIWTLDRDLRITSCNERFKHAIHQDFGVEMGVGDVFIAQEAEAAAGESAGRYSAIYKAALKGKPQQFEAELRDRHGNSIWVQNFLNPIMVDGRVEELSCLAYHITDRKEAQMAMERSLHEKEVLLKEVHHRVKNNLQIVSSIFNLQTAHVENDPRVQGLLRDSRDRIRSMAFIHESLYQTKDLDSVDLAEYIDGLARNLMLSYSLTGKVALELDLSPVTLSLDQAIPCGLILNEIISNALKHAFPQGQGGRVYIKLGEQDGKVHIHIEDNGVGLPEGFDPKRDGNLGLELVQTLMEQLEGRMQITSPTGVAYLLTFERSN